MRGDGSELLTNKVCPCGRPAVAKTKGFPVCARCLDIETKLETLEERRQRLMKFRYEDAADIHEYRFHAPVSARRLSCK